MEIASCIFIWIMAMSWFLLVLWNNVKVNHKNQWARYNIWLAEMYYYSSFFSHCYTITLMWHTQVVLNLSPCCAGMNNRSCYCCFSSVKVRSGCVSLLLWKKNPNSFNLLLSMMQNWWCLGRRERSGFYFLIFWHFQEMYSIVLCWKIKWC